tara:strand:+ start:388 stop:525 length:138 start_codon:yes stop_codon:yes gene_type:complete
MEDNQMMTFEEYLKEELKYCDEYEKYDVLEAHSNDTVCVEIEYQE